MIESQSTITMGRSRWEYPVGLGGKCQVEPFRRKLFLSGRCRKFLSHGWKKYSFSVILFPFLFINLLFTEKKIKKHEMTILFYLFFCLLKKNKKNEKSEYKRIKKLDRNFHNYFCFQQDRAKTKVSITVYQTRKLFSLKFQSKSLIFYWQT